MLGLFTLTSSSISFLLFWLCPRYTYLPARPLPFKVKRLSNNPIIDVSINLKLKNHARQDGYVNINGPSLIRVPNWVENPLAKYYLYFAHHKGSYIRMAYANQLNGPWKLYEPGVLNLHDSLFSTESPAKLKGVVKYLWNNFSIYVFRDILLLGYRSSADGKLRKKRGIIACQDKKTHIASPYVIIDAKNQRLLMYFHGMERNGLQVSRISVSRDGLRFIAKPTIIPATYLRSFQYRGLHYVLGMPGILFRSDSPEGPFKSRAKLLFEPNMRHSSIWRHKNILYVVWSRVGDCPERLLLSEIDLHSENWDDWIPTQGVELLRPDLPWEGNKLALLRSLRGEMRTVVNELRDPFIFEDKNIYIYLLYTGAGEQAIGIAQLINQKNSHLHNSK